MAPLQVKMENKTWKIDVSRGPSFSPSLSFLVIVTIIAMLRCVIEELTESSMQIKSYAVVTTCVMHTGSLFFSVCAIGEHSTDPP